jgi:hypothetical protein
MERKFPIPKLSSDEIERIENAFSEARPNFETDKACVEHLMTVLPYSFSTLRKYGAKGGRDRHTIYTKARKLLINEDTPPAAPIIRKTLAEIDDPEKISELIKAEADARKYKETSANLQKRVLTLEGQLTDMQSRLELFEHLQSESTAMVINPSSSTGGEKGEAVAIVQASDWHVGEFVHPEKVNYWNKYNPDIAEVSARLFFERSVKLIRKEQKEIKINKVLLHLGGDMMTGHIHEELKESTAYSPNEECQFAKHLIIGGLNYWLENIKEVYVVCSYGNHGRNNPEKKISSGAENSYEWAMYHDIARHFENNPRIKFLIPRGEWAYVDIGRYKIRATHLDAVRYVGGVGGISIPLIKAVHNWNAAVHADMTIGGHFHQTLVNDQIGFMVNNCLIGINPYGMRFGRPTPATQNFRLLDLKRGFTIYAPIICDDGDRLEKHTSYPGLTSRWHAPNTNQREMQIPG